MTDDITDLSPDAIWSRSPLSREAVDRILAAPGFTLPPEHPDTEALRLVLAKLADWMVLASLQRPLRVAQSRALLEAFEDLYRAWTAIEQTTPWPVNRPPPLPPDWVQAMMAWGLRESPDGSGGARKSDNLDQEMYPRLLAFFALAYDRQPASTAGGPTIRFLQAFLAEMAMAFAPTQADPTMAQARLRWRKLPTATALQNKVRAHMAAAEVDQAPLVLFNALARPPAALDGGSDPA